MMALTILASTVNLILSFVMIAMLLRAIFSWIPAIDESRVGDFIYTVTEPFIIPVRALFVKMNWLQNTPIDFAFLITYILVSIVQFILSEYSYSFL